MLSRLLTKNYTKVPLYTVFFNLKKYQKYGAKDSCTAVFHPCFKNDEYITQTLKDLCDYIRDNYDMEEMV